MGNVTKVACDGTGDQPSVDPDAGHGDCIEFGSIQNLCDTDNSVIAWKPNTYRVWAADAVEKTYTFKVQTTYSGISAGGLKLTATYLDGVSAGSTAEETHAPAIATVRDDDTDWTQTLAVTVTPGDAGWIDFQIELMEYQSGDEVWVWPEVAIT